MLQEVYIHPKFDTNKEAPNHDIAILRLDRIVPIVQGKISPICLPLSNRFVAEIFDRIVFYSFFTKFKCFFTLFYIKYFIRFAFDQASDNDQLSLAGWGIGKDQMCLTKENGPSPYHPCKVK